MADICQQLSLFNLDSTDLSDRESTTEKLDNAIDSVSSTIKAIQSLMRKDAGIDGDAQHIAQLSWILFYKIFSNTETQLELKEKGYISPIPLELRWHKWAQCDRLSYNLPTGEALINLVNDRLFPTLKILTTDGLDGKALTRSRLLQSAFANAHNYMRSGVLLRQVLDKINEGLDFSQASTRHIFGDIYEQILKSLQSAGNAGEFYTPHALTQFIVSAIAPQLGEKVLDPACGTGGFLACSYEYLTQQASLPDELEEAKQSILGIEKKPLPYLLCVTNLMAHGIETPTTIKHDDTLKKPLLLYEPKDRVDVIVANPPYGATVEDNLEWGFPRHLQTKETADLFLVWIIEQLKEKGRAAVVLPDGIMFGKSVKTRIKQKLLIECNLHTIVRLPNGVFAPYTPISTNILFFTKGEPTANTWYYEHICPEGLKAYTKTRPMQAEELEPLKDWWSNRQECDRAWLVPIQTIESNGYNLDIKNPNNLGNAHEDPRILLEQYQEAVREVERDRDVLREALREILEQVKN